MFSPPSPDNVQLYWICSCLCRESVPHRGATPQLVSRHGPWNSLFLWRVASVTEPKIYAFYSIDGAYVVLAPNGNNLPEQLDHTPCWQTQLTQRTQTVFEHSPKKWSTILLPSKVRLILEVLRYLPTSYISMTVSYWSWSKAKKSVSEANHVASNTSASLIGFPKC